MKKIYLFISIIIIVTVVICQLMYPSYVSETLDATKLDAKGNAIGTTQIPFFVTRYNYLFFKRIHTVYIDEFDDQRAYSVSDFSRFSLDPGRKYWKLTSSINLIGFDSDSPDLTDPNALTNQSYIYTLCFSRDLNRWMISISHNSGEKVYYVGSVGQKYTAEELVDYFGI